MAAAPERVEEKKYGETAASMIDLLGARLRLRRAPRRRRLIRRRPARAPDTAGTRGEFALSGFPRQPTNFEEQQVISDVNHTRSPNATASAAALGALASVKLSRETLHGVLPAFAGERRLEIFVTPPGARRRCPQGRVCQAAVAAILAC
jgi:hypothetical protein